MKYNRWLQVIYLAVVFQSGTRGAVILFWLLMEYLGYSEDTIFSHVSGYRTMSILLPEIVWGFWHFIPALLLASVKDENLRTVSAFLIAGAWLLSFSCLIYADRVQTLWISTFMGFALTLTYACRFIGTNRNAVGG